MGYPTSRLAQGCTAQVKGQEMKKEVGHGKKAKRVSNHLSFTDGLLCKVSTARGLHGKSKKGDMQGFATPGRHYSLASRSDLF